MHNMTRIAKRSEKKTRNCLKVSKEALDDTNFEIKTSFPDWMEAVREYNNYDDEEWYIKKKEASRVQIATN